MDLKSSFCLLFSLFGVIFAEKWSCDKNSDRELDQFMSQLLTFGSTRKYPEVRADLKSFCDENYILIKKIEEYNKQCLDSLSKQTVGLILYSIKSLIDSYCKKNSKYAEDLLSAAPCANKATREFNKCHIQYIDALIAGKKMGNQKDVTPLICCDYHKIFDCVHQKGRSVQGCTDKILDISEDFVKAHFERVFNLLCADYGEQTDRCDKVPDIRKLIPKGKRRRPKTFILPLANLLKGLPEV